MSKSQLAYFLLIIFDVAIVLYFSMVIYALIKGRVYAFGEWFYKENRSMFYQYVVGYILLGIFSLYIRYVVFPDEIYKYL